MKVSSELVKTITELTGDGFCLCEMIVDDDGNPVDYRFLEVNDHFETYTGLKDAKGRTALELVPDLESHWVETYARVGLGREAMRFENGSVPMGRWFDVYASPAEPHGRLTILFRDVTARKVAEREREQALAEAKRLLHELNHRVKNSLSLISSIFSLEARAASDEAGEVLLRVRSRVGAVADLYGAISDAGSIDTVGTEAYLSRIVDALQGSIAEENGIEIDTRIDDVTVSSKQAVALGLVLNELVTNCAKHAFSPGKGGVISVRLTNLGETFLLEVSDNGSGTKTGDDPAQGLGAQLISAFVTDLDGDLERTSGPEGTAVRVTVPIRDR